MEQLYQLFGTEADDFLHPKMKQESKIMDLPMARQRSNGGYRGEVGNRVCVLGNNIGCWYLKGRTFYSFIVYLENIPLIRINVMLSNVQVIVMQLLALTGIYTQCTYCVHAC